MTAYVNAAYTGRVEFFLQRDDNGTPKDLVVWRVWMGGHEEVARFPWTVDGLREAGPWLVERQASWRHNGFVLRDPQALMVHAGAR